MKHTTSTTANGLCTPPCGSSLGNLSSFRFRNSLLMLFLLLIVGSNAAWAASSTAYFTPGATIYFHVTGSAVWTTNSGSYQVILFDKDDNTKAIKTDNSTTIVDACDQDHSCNLYNYTGSGHHIASDVRRSTTKENDNYYYFTIPESGKHVGFIRLIRNDYNVDGWSHQHQPQLSADDVPSDKNCFAYTALDEGAVTFEAHNFTSSVTTGNAPALSGDFYVYGAGPNDAMNWVTGWSSVEQGGGKSNPLNHMTISGNVARKTYCGVKGNNLEFKIAQNNADEATWTKYNSSKTTATGPTGGFFTAATNNNGNIRFSLSKPSDVTVCYDGTDVWLEIYERVQSSTRRRACGTFNSWSATDAELTQDDTHGCYSVTLQNVEPRGTVYDGHQYMHFKIFKQGNNPPQDSWSGAMTSGGDCDIHAMGATVLGDASVDDEANPNNEHRIIVQVDVTSNITIEYYLKGASNGRKQIAINCVPVAAPPVSATTYTVTLHPNNGGASTIVKENVPEGSTSSAAALNLSAVKYGNGTATWYTNEECTTPFTSVTEDNMNLYAKWGVSGNFYIGGDMWMHEKNGNNWAYYSTMAMTTTDGVASVTYIAPKGRNRFEILTTRSNWTTIANQGSGLIASSTPELSWAKFGPDNNNHFVFDLDAPKKVTIRYNGKVSITAEDYDVVKTGWTVVSPTLFGNGSDDNADYADNGAFMSGYNVTEGQMNENGERVFRNVNQGTYKFWIGKYNTNLDKTKQQIEVFGAANVDKDYSSLSGYGSLADNNNAHINRNIPQDDKLHRRVTFTLTQKADIKIAFDGGKIKVNVLPTHTVTFKNGETTFTTAQVFDGNVATAPASNPEKAGHEFTGWDWNFTTPITEDQIIINAQFSYKPIESVSLNESAHATWIGNDDFILTPTLTPSDLIAKSVAWTSDAEGVATVSNGTVHAVSAGTATITCTVTDQFDNARSATCKVTVAACEMTTDNLYSMTVTGYNSKTGDNADLSGLWNESSDNTEPASMTITRLAFHKKNAGNTLYAYDDNGTVKVKEDASGNDVQWILIPVGENYTPSWNGGNACQLYYIKNVSTGKFMHRGTQGQDGSGFNVQWWYSVTNTNATNAATDDYKWFFVNENDNQRGVYVKSGVGDSKPNSYKLHSSNEFNNCTDTYAPKPMLPVGRTADMNDYAKSYKNTNDFNYDTYSNPNYKASQMNSSYYRMKENATVRANLENALVYGSVITVRLYADAATTVQLTKADGTEIETINLTADAALEYTYTVAYDSELVGETAFVIKAADNHAGIASIEVSRTHAASPDDPALTWDADLSGGVTRSELAGTFQHVASSARSEGAIHYSSSDETVATVAADGTVTPLKAGSTTITATIKAEGCYAEASIPYGVTLTEPTLAELIAADAGEGITLTRNYAEDIVIDKAITIDGAGHAIGNLTVKTEGDLTLSGALTVNDFSIYAKAGNTTTPAASGQVRNATNLTANGNAYFYYTVDPSGQVHYGWYDFTVPFRVNVMTGIKGIQEGVLKENFVNETDYAIMEHLGEKQAAGEYAYKKFRGVMEPCRLYSITLDDDYNYNTIRFQKADGGLVAGNEVALNSYYSAVDDKHANWNGVGNGTLHHADAGLSVATIQVYQSGNKTFLPVDRAQYSLVIGSAFMVQQTGTMTLNQATHSPLLAPKRAASVQPTAIQIAREGQPFSDQLFISADETAGQGYTQGVDVAKAGNIGNVNVPQIWTNAYNSKLCAHEAQLINGEAQYDLSLYAPANGSYTLTSKNIPEGYTLYLTQNGNRIWDLSERYVLDLTKGTATEYGLLLVENYKMPTAVENIGSKADETQKIMHNGILYILRNGKVFNAQGAHVK